MPDLRQHGGVDRRVEQHLHAGDQQTPAGVDSEREDDDRHHAVDVEARVRGDDGDQRQRRGEHIDLAMLAVRDQGRRQDALAQPHRVPAVRPRGHDGDDDAGDDQPVDARRLLTGLERLSGDLVGSDEDEQCDRHLQQVLDLVEAIREGRGLALGEPEPQPEHERCDRVDGAVDGHGDERETVREGCDEYGQRHQRDADDDSPGSDTRHGAACGRAVAGSR